MVKYWLKKKTSLETKDPIVFVCKLLTLLVHVTFLKNAKPKQFEKVAVTHKLLLPVKRSKIVKVHPSLTKTLQASGAFFFMHFLI